MEVMEQLDNLELDHEASVGAGAGSLEFYAFSHFPDTVVVIPAGRRDSHSRCEVLGLLERVLSLQENCWSVEQMQSLKCWIWD